MVKDGHDLPAALIAEAKRKPGGWVYEIVGNCGPNDAVPPTAIRGPWKVGENGEVVGRVPAGPSVRAAFKLSGGVRSHGSFSIAG